MTKSEPWYAIFSGRFRGDQPFFYDPQDLEWAQVFEDNWETIRDELFALSKENPERVQPYSFNHAMAFPPKHWKTMGIMFWGLRMHENYKKCPKTVEIMKSVPGVTSLSMSILEPGSNINPHQGDTDAVYRCHLGIKVPAPLPDCGFQVGTEIKGWEEGKLLVFCDAQTHTAWNQSDERRIVVIFDVMRPEFHGQTRSICAHVLASMLIQQLYTRNAWLTKLQAWVKRWMYEVFRVLFLVYIPLQQRLGGGFRRETLPDRE
ncbi:MAG: aspartyl/asparaginyl beta-hydroxylase domain-containing protein [Thalassovita sp.]